MDCQQVLLSDENLRIAYLRARHAIENFEGLVVHDEIAEWETDLELQIERVRKLLQEDFDGIPCRLTPIPKGQGQARAYYSIPMEFQVGWMAILGAIGPLLDRRMPNWSFGYRLYRPRIRTSNGSWLWDEYRNNSEEAFLGFAKSWKPFRRYANLTLNRFLGEQCSGDPVEIDIQKAEEALESAGYVPGPRMQPGLDLRRKRLLYFEDNWVNRKEQLSRVWYARLDIKNFFPSIKCQLIPPLLVNELTGLPGFAQPEYWKKLFKRWLNFKEETYDLRQGGLRLLTEQRVGDGGLPVGLIAAGFLANVFMLPVDRQIEKALKSAWGEIAVLRYVDDFVVLAASMTRLAEWLQIFVNSLKDKNLFINLKKGKIAPDELLPVIKKLEQSPEWRPSEAELRKLLKKNKFQNWHENGTVTQFDRKEFISTTLQRMSFRAGEDPEMLDESELDYRFLDLLDLAAAGAVNAEVRHETLHAFSAGQLQRTPLFSPAALFAATGADDDGDFGSVEGVRRQIWRRGISTIHQLMAAVTAAPNKNRLILRCVQVAAEVVQFIDKKSKKEKQSSPSDKENQINSIFRSFLGLLLGQEGDSDSLAWHVGEKGYRSLRQSLLGFLRMRFWNAISDELLLALKEKRFLSKAELGERVYRIVPARKERIERKLSWLKQQGDLLNSLISAKKRNAGFADVMEEAARRRWERLSKLAGNPQTGHILPGVLQKGDPTPAIWISYGRTLLLWTEPNQEGPLATAARKTLERWIESALADGAWSYGEHCLARDWLLQDPGVRLGDGRILERLVAEQAGWLELPERQARSTYGWIREFLWGCAASEQANACFKTIVTSSIPALERCDVRQMAINVAQQIPILSNEASEPSLISFQYLFESKLWANGRQNKENTAHLFDAPEPLRVFLLRSLLRWINGHEMNGLCLSPDNLYVDYNQFMAVRNALMGGNHSSDIEIHYVQNLRDPFYEISDAAPDFDQMVVAGLVGIQLLAGTRALDHVLRRRPRRQIDAQDVLIAFEDAPAVSREAAGIVASLCMSPRWERMDEGVRKTYETLLGVRPLSNLETAEQNTNEVLDFLCKQRMQRDDKASYLIWTGGGQPIGPSESATEQLPQWLKVGLVQPNINLHKDEHWDPYGQRLQMCEDFAELHAWPAVWQGLRAVRAGMRIAARSNEDSSPPAVVVIPELTVPRRRVAHLKRFAQRENIIIIAGVEYRSENRWVRNEAVVVVPTEDRFQTANARCFWVGKHYPAPGEAKYIAKHGFRFVSTPDLAAFDTQRTGRFGVSICYDLYAVQTLVGFQGKILHLFVAAYNQDLQTFDSLGDTAMRLLFANVVIANGGTYGGSLAVSPYYKPHKREVLRVRGQEIAASENFCLPLRLLREAQQGRDNEEKPLFKHRPADWPTEEEPSA